MWFTASVRGLLTGRQGVVRTGERLAYVWETRILLSRTADKGITVLDFKQPGPIPREDIAKLPASSSEEELSAWLEIAKSQHHTDEFRSFLNRVVHSAWPADSTELEAALRRMTSSPGDRSLWAEFLRNLEQSIEEDEGEQ